jgi:predicted SAM-dependent methyltransferase
MRTSLTSSLWIRLFPSSAAAHRVVDAHIIALRSDAQTGLNLGCGDHPIDGLINCDLFSPRADLKIDILCLTQFADESVDLIEAHHLFEHLSFSERSPALAEWHRVLKPGGRLVLSVPDLPAVCIAWLRGYLLGYSSVDAEGVAYEDRMLFGPQSNPGMFHRSGYGRRTLAALLVKSGFRVEFSMSPFPRRSTPSLFMIAVKI